MDERQFARVQHHAGCGVIRQFFQARILPRAVGVIAHERMADELKMHADLVRAPGVDLRFHQRRRVKPFENFVARVRGATRAVVAHGHAFAVRGMSRDGRVDFGGGASRFAADERVVNLVNFARRELFREREVRLVIFGDDQTTTRFLVEAMHDARSRHAADAAQRALAVMQQRIDERVFLVTGGGMHDESGGFVDDEQRFILEQNIERDFFRLRLGGFGIRPVNFDFFARVRMMRGFDDFAVDADVAFFDQSLQRAARGGGKFLAQEFVEPLVGQRLLDDEIFRA